MFKDSEDRLDPSILQEHQFLPSEAIHPVSNQKGIVFRSTTHFLLGEKYLITDLSYPKKIRDMEVYLKYLAESDLFRLLPKVSPPPEISLYDVKEIEIGDTQSSFLASEDRGRGSFFNRVKTLSKEGLSFILGENSDLINEDLAEFMSGKVVLCFKRPSGMSKEDYKRRFSMTLRPMSDLDNVSFTTRNGKKIKAKDILVDKKINVNMTENGYISEHEVSQEMRIFLDEIH